MEKEAREVAKTHRKAPLATPSSLSAEARKDLGAALNGLLADVFALYFKTRNFHWHISGANFRDYHRMFDEQGDELLGMSDPLAERVRKLGETTLRSVGHVSRVQRISDNDAEFVTPDDMLAELRDDNQRLGDLMREVHGVCEEHRDIATASLLEPWIDEAEHRTWYLFEAGRRS